MDLCRYHLIRNFIVSHFTCFWVGLYSKGHGHVTTWRFLASKNGTILCQMAFFDVELTISGTNRNCVSLIHPLNEFDVLQHMYNDLSLLYCASFILQHVVLPFFQISGKPIRSPSRPEFPWRARSKCENARRTCAKSGDNSWKGWTVHRFRIIDIESKSACVSRSEAVKSLCFYNSNILQ